MENITLNIIAFNIFERIRGKIKDDDSISIDLIKDEIHSTRALLIKQRFDRAPLYIDSVYCQSLGPVEIEMIDSSILAITSGKNMFRTVREIPSTIERRNQEGTFLRIGPSDMLDVKYTLVSYMRALKSGNGRFNKDYTYAFIRDNKIYLINKSPIAPKYIDVIGVFQNPKDVMRFKDSSGDSLYSDDTTYPISRSMITDLENIVVQNLMLKLQVRSDNVNNASNNELEQ